MTAMLTEKNIRFQSCFLRNEHSDLDKSHLYDDFVPNYSHRINTNRHVIMRDAVDSGSLGEIDPGLRRRRNFESRSAPGCQEAFNEITAVDSHVQHCGSNTSLSPRRDLTKCIQQQQQQQPNSILPSSSYPEQSQSHTTAHEMSLFVPSSVSGCLEVSCERRLRRLQCLIEEQNKALGSQSRKLERLHYQIDSYETATHSRRISEDGPDYICRAYLGKVTEERAEENGCSKSNEEIKASELLSVTQDAKRHAERAEDEDRASTAMVGPQTTRISEPVHELNEVDELKREFHRLVAISDSQNRQLLEISDEIAKHDELIWEKRLLCEHLEEQLLMNDYYEEIYGQNYSRDQHPDIADDSSHSTGGLIESDFESEDPQNKRLADRNIPLKPYFTLETLLDSDTGLSSLGSESPAELSPI